MTILALSFWHSLKQVVKGHGLITVGAFECLTAHLRGETHLLQVLDFVVEGDLASVVLSPLSGLPVECLEVALEHLSYHRILRIIRLGGA